MRLDSRVVAVGGIILTIILMSIFGASRAFRSITGQDSADERIESVRVDPFASEGDQTLAQSDSRTSTEAASQSNGGADVRTLDENGEIVLSPLQEAGTFIQRQKRIEEDPTVLGTEVTVLAVADSATVGTGSVTAEPNTITPAETSPDPDSTASPSSLNNTAPATAPAVPALW